MQQLGRVLAPSVTAPSTWRVAISGLIALAAAVGIGRFAFTPILPMMQEDLGVTVAQGGWLASANYAGYLLGALWATVQRTRPDRTIRLALIVTAVATVAMAYAGDLPAWFVLRLVAGVASAWALIHVTSWCVEHLALAGKPMFSGVVFAGVGAGIILAGALCLALMQAQAASRDAWLVLGCAGLLASIVVWPVLGVNSTSKTHTRTPKHAWTLDSVRLVACYGAFGLGYIIPATFVPAMAKRMIQDPMIFGWAWPLFGLAAVTSTLFAAVLMRAFTNRGLWMIGAFVMAVGVVGPLLVPGLLGILIAALLVGGTFMVTTMAGIQEARTVAGASASVLVAAMTAAFACGQIIGPLIVSALVRTGDGFQEALLLSFGVLICSVAALAIRRPSAL